MREVLVSYNGGVSVLVYIYIYMSECVCVCVFDCWLWDGDTVIAVRSTYAELDL